MENNYSKSLDVINIGRGANGSFAKDALIDDHYLISKPYLTLVESMSRNGLSLQNVSQDGIVQLSNKDEACTLSTITPKLDDVLLSWFYKQKQSQITMYYISINLQHAKYRHNANVGAKNKTNNRLTKTTNSF